MLGKDLSFSKTLNPSFSLFPLSTPKSPPNSSARRTVSVSPLTKTNSPLSVKSSDLFLPKDGGFFRRDVRALAGRSKKKPGGGSSGGRIEGDSDARKQAKRNAREKSKKLAESLFYRLYNNPDKTRTSILSSHPDKFTEDELEMIGLGYDRMVRFMDKDDPRLRHPHDWFKYGEFGPYSWRGVVVGDPVRGTISDECVTMIGEVDNHEGFEKIEQHEMNVAFQKRVKELDSGGVGLRYFWVFVRHPKWRLSELPWEQWTLVSEVVVEVDKKKRLDKWNLMGRLGNKSRSLICKCAAWFRPDIVYVKKPVFQCRFEPQEDFFNSIMPYLNPVTEAGYVFEVEDDDGGVEFSTYYGGLCKMLKVRQTAFVDDVVKAYEKCSDEKKSRVLKFLLGNHPVELLHPYTKEWKAKLEEMELGCDAPDEEEDEVINSGSSEKAEFSEWVEDEGDDSEMEEEEEEDEDDNMVVDVEGNVEEDSFESEADEADPEEDERYWEEQFKKATSNAERMEKLAEMSMAVSDKFYEKQLKAMAEREDDGEMGLGGDELEMRGKKAKVKPEEWKTVGYGRWMKKIKKSRIPPELFLRAAVRPFVYRNLVKEIVLTRHAILEGEIGQKE
ncbi:hypothetical protein Rs2_20438 [Raphanus sativus]|uniref:Uncharacterized protein LOC108862972 n=1 Tax=Raphanus sativus TaxID=3726 RepID=A0A6J0P7Y8_RAPSA|nr:uncharacterized protein LOC108862972 [Raphanus sativus]KAJ4893644.1 hypothetical protein Rs2_20438 [Raphanus sativus]